MAKKDALYAEAQRLFTHEQCTIGEIASRLKCGERTIRNWKEEAHKEGNDWDTLRSQYRASRTAFHEELYEFTRWLMRSIKEDELAGKPVSPGRYFTLGKLLPNIAKVKDYEDAVKNAEKPAGSSGTVPEDIVKLIQRDVLGIPG
ncbi:MAG: DUF1804 family protein [Fibrobacter sp.]|nr:DUF1804 family protein [Fibrobacter sp.]